VCVVIVVRYTSHSYICIIIVYACFRLSFSGCNHSLILQHTLTCMHTGICTFIGVATIIIFFVVGICNCSVHIMLHAILPYMLVIYILRHQYYVHVAQLLASRYMLMFLSHVCSRIVQHGK